MAFESKRLRVQLPCKKAGTLVEKEPDPEARRIPDFECAIFGSCRFRTPINCGFPSPQGCVFCTWDSPACRFFDTPIPTICREFRTEIGRGTQCEIPSIDPGTETILVDPDPEDPNVVLLRPEDLGRFRRQLQDELDRIESLEERRGQIEGQLKELDSAEKALKKQSKRK